MDNQELEVKFFVCNLPAIKERVIEMGGNLTQKRVLERNLRLDTPDQRLREAYQVLRLRLDTEARLTYKGPAISVGGARLRQEIEFTVSSFEKAQTLLHALGYEIVLIYEKYREIFDVRETHVTLDELPYGSFVEIEGPDVAEIHAVSDALGLSWEASVPASYILLFEMLKTKRSLGFRDLSFENFVGLTVTAKDLEVTPAD